FWQVTFVVLNCYRQLTQTRPLSFQVVFQIQQRLDIGIDGSVLTVSDEDDTVSALEHELPRRVVVDLTGHGVELQLRSHTADFSDVEGEEVEEERAIGLRGQREHLALRIRGKGIVNKLQIGGFAA